MKACLIYGYGQLANGDIDEQTEGRCDETISLFFDQPVKNRFDRIFITVSAQKNGVLMAEKMRDYLVKYKIPREKIMIAPWGMNTAGETDVFLNLVGQDDELHAVSTWYHIPRIWWLWQWRRPVHLHISWKSAHWADLKIEPLKMVKAILFPRRSAKIAKE